jgi:hypothetical protein
VNPAAGARSPYLQPMSAREIVLNALRIYRDHLRLLVLVALFPHLALLALEMLLLAAGDPGPEAFALLLAATVVMNGVALAALTVATGRAALGEDPGVLEVYGQTVRSHLGQVVVAYFITAVLVSAGMMVLLVPGIMLGSLFAPSVPLIVVERLGVVQGLTRSVTMMKSEWLRGTVTFSFFILVAGFLPLILLIAQGNATAGPLTPLLSAIIGAATLPLGFAANVMLYFSLRTTDAADAQQLQSALRPPPPT